MLILQENLQLCEMTESEEIHRFVVGLIVRKGQRFSPHGGLGVTLCPEWLKILLKI